MASTSMEAFLLTAARQTRLRALSKFSTQSMNSSPHRHPRAVENILRRRPSTFQLALVEHLTTPRNLTQWNRNETPVKGDTISPRTDKNSVSMTFCDCRCKQTCETSKNRESIGSCAFSLLQQVEFDQLVHMSTLGNGEEKAFEKCSATFPLTRLSVNSQSEDSTLTMSNSHVR